ncbi:PASTA domain-containing protein [Epidermidibacterium keratini]|uniref:non-specific serine/threonine protein kinase n=1 Tax=Epidermidibacterium keratini TaxID=1891644 RepID=A0A7L4YIJ2_9ACTN|nr:Stk1 family PASTA domain-containing Ser/Thr kinase [Epidermidibacterium keratini]QHB99165.1 PASTA domain-containing protein [Epidermidibacterium keratini]
MSSTTQDPLVGALLDGRYRVLRRLASGGMSRVYLGHDDRLDRPVAIKVMNSDLAADPPFLARFTREARAAARILHPNIVTVHDQGTDPDHDAVYLVMELVRGGTLRDLLRVRDRLSPAEALAIIEPVLTGLAAAHREGLVHRDIKPENILIDGNGRVLIADFGLARAVAESSHTTHSGMGGAVFGTIAYLSPEQITKGYADARSDVYATGVMLYEMLTGFPPYVADNPVSVAYRHVNDDIPPPSEKLPDSPGELDDLVIDATTRDPLVRPADAGQFLAMVREAQASLDARDTAVPVPPAPPALSSSTAADHDTDDDQDPPADERAASTLPTDDEDEPGRTRHVARAAAADLGGPGDPVRTHAIEDSDAEQHQAPRRRRRRWLVPLAALLAVALVAGGVFWWVQYGRWTTVPDLSQASSEKELSQAADDAGLAIKLEQAQFSETVPEGAVISTDPKSGERVVRGTQIQVVLSKGLERYYADSSSIGQPATDVISDMEEEYAGRVTITQTTAYSETVAKGAVVGFSPPAGTAMAPGSSVEVTISDGKEPIELPDVTGKSPEEATQILTDAGFEPTVSSTQEFSDAKAGTVARTDPPAGTLAQPGAGVAITIVVSKGPDLVEVPSVIGKKTADATAALEAAGFTVEVKTVFTTLDLVADQSPGGGTMAKRGSTVTITVV